MFYFSINILKHLFILCLGFVDIKTWTYLKMLQMKKIHFFKSIHTVCYTSFKKKVLVYYFILEKNKQLRKV